MKKLLSALLVLVMMVGLCVGAGAQIDPEDPTTWPVLALNQRVTLDFFGYTEEDLNGNSGLEAFMSFYRFTPVKSGWYFFEVLGPSFTYRYVYVITKDNTEEWDESDFHLEATKTIYLEGGKECFVIAQAVYSFFSAEGTFQLLVQNTNDPSLTWWQTLPPFLQTLLRWLAFGWLWMR